MAAVETDPGNSGSLVVLRGETTSPRDSLLWRPSGGTKKKIATHQTPAAAQQDQAGLRELIRLEQQLTALTVIGPLAQATHGRVHRRPDPFVR